MSDVIGHTTIVRYLQGLAKNGGLGHGYIFYGPTMTGKRTFAVAFAHLLENGTFSVPPPEFVFQDAKIIDRSASPDLKDSISIDAVREIKNFLWQKPNVSSRRPLIIDEADLLTTEAQNALLKVTEEPPGSSLLIIIASDIASIMPTILSRLPKLYFGTVAEHEIEAWLMNGHGMAKAKAAVLAKRSLGKPGLALRLLCDKDFQDHLALAGAYIASPKSARKDLIKKIIEPDDFNVRNFLEAVIMNLAWEKPSKTKAALWHRALALYGNVNNFGLNPRLQLEALLV